RVTTIRTSGTKWCGDGDIAKSEDDLGHFIKLDICCRGHDLCRNDIAAGEKMKNLYNTGIFTRSACSCDAEFYNCLKKGGNSLCDFVGKTYFNILQPQCFKCVCPENCK
ncbi:Phospholipase A2, partial [Harpegnathos saltator]